MRRATLITLGIIRVTGIVQVVLGLLFWSGRAYALLPLHMLIGTIFVITLWVMAGIAARAGLSPLLVFGVVAWGIVIPVVGITQMQILPGPYHWIVRLGHLLIGLAGMGMADRMADFILHRSHRAARARGSMRRAA